MKLSFTVLGPPAPKKRPRTVRNKKTGKVHTYTPQATINYEHKIGWTAVAAKKSVSTPWPVEGVRYRMTVLIVHASEQRKPDFDNVLKSIADGCEGVLWKNDSKVKCGSWDELVSPENPRIEVEVEVL